MVAEDKTVVIGMAGIQIHDLQTAEIRGMCILPDYRRKGLGSKMCNKLMNHAKELGVTNIFLSTPEHGDDVLNFYNKLGFQDTGKRELLHGSRIQEIFLEWVEK